MNAYASADPLGRSMVGVMDRTITSVATSPSSSFKQKRPSSGSGSKPSAASPLEKRPSKPTSPSTASKPPETLNELIRVYEALNAHLMEQAATTQRETQHAHAALAEATSEAERAAVMHAEECKKLTTQLAERMRREQDELGDAYGGDKQSKRLMADLKEKQKRVADLEHQLSSSGATMRDELQQVGLRLTESKAKVAKLEMELNEKSEMYEKKI